MAQNEIDQEESNDDHSNLIVKMMSVISGIVGLVIGVVYYVFQSKSLTLVISVVTLGIFTLVMAGNSSFEFSWILIVYGIHFGCLIVSYTLSSLNGCLRRKCAYNHAPGQDGQVVGRRQEQ